jgi:hypothetical protein
MFFSENIFQLWQLLNEIGVVVELYVTTDDNKEEEEDVNRRTGLKRIHRSIGNKSQCSIVGNPVSTIIPNQISTDQDTC